MKDEGTVAEVLAGEARFAVVEGDCREVLAGLPAKSIDVIVTDPPYSAQVHQSVRSSKRSAAPDVAKFKCRTRRTVDLGFEHLRPEVRRAVARETARVVRRWALFFSDVESCWMWRISLEAAGLDYVRTLEWQRDGGAPQFTGDRPASGFEVMTLVHPKGRKRWDGGGSAGTYRFPIVANRLGQRGTRVHTTQKPEGLMVALVDDFSDPGEVVLDLFAGSSTTGVAALRRGRRFIGIERKREHVETSRERLLAECIGLTLPSYRAKQVSLFAAVGGGK